MADKEKEDVKVEKQVTRKMLVKEAEAIVKGKYGEEYNLYYPKLIEKFSPEQASEILEIRTAMLSGRAYDKE